MRLTGLVLASDVINYFLCTASPLTCCNCGKNSGCILRTGNEAHKNMPSFEQVGTVVQSMMRGPGDWGVE